MSEGSYEHEKLIALKEEITNSIFPDFEYNRIELLSEILYQQLLKHLDELFPLDDSLSAFESEQFRQKAFQKKLTRHYLPNEDLNLEIDTYISEPQGPVIMTGEIGTGKSAFLAHWVQRHKEHHPEDVVIAHFIGASPSSTNFMNILTGILQELQNSLSDFKDSVKAHEILERFSPILEHIASRHKKRRIILVIDGLDHLEERESAKEMTWLPQNFPKTVRVILSTSNENKIVSVLTRRGYSFVEMTLFQQGTRKRFIQTLLKSLSKSLSEKTEMKIAAAPQCSVISCF